MEETIVAVYDAAEHATLAVRDLEAAGVPSNAISQHAASSASRAATTETTGAHEQGFWASLFGATPEHDHDTAVYDRSLVSGSTVVTVRAPEQYVAHTMEILERHNPIDIDERAGSYGVTQTTTTTASTGTPSTGRAPAATPGVTSGGTAATLPASGTETLALSEESLAVGKRAVNRGTTRVRRYVVETPVQETVKLRDETVSIERRPVTGTRPVTNADFGEKIIEMTETTEEVVASKTAHVREEVVIHKEAVERNETVHDTVRREDVEITKNVGAEPARAANVDPKTTIPRSGI